MQGAQMAMSTPQAYVTQWLQTATNGTVTGEFSLMHNRMRLRCLKCGLTLTAPEPTGTTIDYGVQEFVKLHAHKQDSWKCLNCGELIGTSLTEHAPDCKPAAWQGVTADFKKIDDKPEMAQKIISATQAVVNEYAAKDDAYFAAKIAELQKRDEGKIVHPFKIGNALGQKTYKLAKEVQQHPETGEYIKVIKVEYEPTATDAELKQVEEELKKKKAQENALKIQALKQQIMDLANHEIVPHVSPPKKADGGGILKIATGRKFR
jgi:hypothetical protein